MREEPHPSGPILTPADGPVVDVVNPDGAAAIVLVCEHAANRIPRALGNLGLSADAITSHIAWDLAAYDLAQDVAFALDAPLVACRYSRLVYDCNRPLDAVDAIPERSETYEIPGNCGLGAATRLARQAEFYTPFHAAVAATIDRKTAMAPPVIVTIHTFTPTYFGVPRAVQLGVLHDTDARLADAILAHAGATGLRAERNAPYGPADGVTHTLRTHALPRGLPNVMLEVRNDLVARPGDRAQVAGSLVQLLRDAMHAAGIDPAPASPVPAKG